jgi:large subunit ribosomal protein L6
MSRIGKIPISLPEGVSFEKEGRTVKISGPKGVLGKKLPQGLEAEEKDGKIIILAKSKAKTTTANHGTYRALIYNMVKGVTEGWSKKLELVGTGYRAQLKGNDLELTVGFSHPVEVKAPDGIKFSVEKTVITVEGIDKELVGQIAAQIRAVRPPEPYKGKGIKYIDEVVRRKPGKAAKAQGAAV